MQHVRCETLGIIGEALESRDILYRYVRSFEEQAVPPEMGEAAGLIVMGGPMGVYEEAAYPFLAREMRLIERALLEGKPVLGICLGSQLLAAALGTRVGPGKRREIGWHTVRLHEGAKADPLWAGAPDSFTAFHWHGDVFPLPKDSVLLASSERTACQAFRYGQHAYGILFHMEFNRGMIQEMTDAFADELEEAGENGAEVVKRARDYLAPLQGIGKTVFDRWAGLVKAREVPR